MTLPSSAASERNRQPILDVLRDEFRERSSVLEIGSGTGQHAVFFAAALPHLVWQTSDLPEQHGAIRAWLEHARLPNVQAPLALEVESADLGDRRFDAMFSANTAHIMGIEGVRSMFALAGRVLPEGGMFCLYGPFRFEGRFTSPSNAEFDESLRRRDPAMGVRDLVELDGFAAAAGLTRARLYAMPANNHIVVWVKAPRAKSEAKEGR